MKTRNWALLSALSTILVASVAQASITVATFADPSNNASMPLFSASASQVAGGWTTNGLTLLVAANSTASSYNSYSNVHFAFDNGTAATNVARTATALGAGRISFYTGSTFTSASTILTVTFNAGTIFEPFVLGASYVNAQNVTFSGSALAGVGSLSNQQFSFAFANPVTVAGAPSTYTASYTSSADAVPEPMSLVALGLAGAFGIARRRKA